MTSYDQIAYINAPFEQTHPSRMHVIARLHGLEPPPVETCRVLELGASEGSNLIGMAIALPGAEFTGIDLAASPIARGKQVIADLALPNVRLLQMDLLDIDAAFGEFDYIIVHGIYAWTPAAVRDKVLAIARVNLHPKGLAFVSYNTYPGAYLRQAMREMMLYHVAKVENPAARLSAARDFVRTFTGGRPVPDALDNALAAIAAELSDSTDSSLFHDALAGIYRPVYFHDFVSHAASHQLQYVDDAAVFDAFPRNVSDEGLAAARRMSNEDWIREQQSLDLLRARTFRQSLLCHAGSAVSAS